MQGHFCTCIVRDRIFSGFLEPERILIPLV